MARIILKSKKTRTHKIKTNKSSKIKVARRKKK